MIVVVLYPCDILESNRLLKSFIFLAGAYLADCAPKQPSNAAAADEGGLLREALWVATETQLAEAVEKAGLNK